MKKSNELKDSRALGALSGLVAGGGWYFAANSMLSGTAQTVVPVFGALVLAATLPAFLSERKDSKKYKGSRFSMLQCVQAFDRHASIKVLDDRDNLSEVNKNFLDLVGYERGELINKPVSLLYEALPPDALQKVGNALRRGESWEGQTPLRRKDGRVIYTQSTIMPIFNPEGTYAGSISVRTDASKTNELIAQRHIAETLYELRDDVWIIDAQTETFSYMNHSAANRFNCENGSYRDKTASELPHQKDTVKLLEAGRALKASGHAMTRFEADVFGIPADVSIKFLPGVDDAGRYLILISDISERIAQEKEKSAFISTVSHELRSPLTSIKGAMGLLLSGSAGELSDKGTSLLEIAHRNADRLILIINDLLDLDKIAKGKMEFELKDVDLAALVREANEATAILQQRFGVHVELIGADGPVPFQTDPNRFIQVLTNLLSNAYKFSAAKSSIWIKIEDSDSQVRISVKDEGQGIPVQEQHKIFARFSDMENSDRAAKGGTGLGLNICKAIVETMGGTIGFDTMEGAGTTFYFCLPKPGFQTTAQTTASVKLSA